jgi:hypothetical protein
VEFDASKKISTRFRLLLLLAAAGLLSACVDGAGFNNAPAWLQDDNAIATPATPAHDQG